MAEKRNRKTKNQMTNERAQMVRMLKEGMSQYDIMLTLKLSGPQYTKYLAKAFSGGEIKCEDIRPKNVLLKSIPEPMAELLPNVKEHEDEFVFRAEPFEGKLLVTAIPKTEIGNTNEEACVSETSNALECDAEDVEASTAETTQIDVDE